jgi:hypothetical protein
VLLIGAVLMATPAAAELGWQAADYVAHVGRAVSSPTADPVRFAAPLGGGSVLVRFADGHSREEFWTSGTRTDLIPTALQEAAAAAVTGTPVRRVDFHLARAPVAEIFETHTGDVTIQVDRRAGRIVHIARCYAPCVLLGQQLDVERAMASVLARQTPTRRPVNH